MEAHRTRWTDDRLDDLVLRLRDEIKDLRAQLRDLRAETREEMRVARGDRSRRRVNRFDLR